MLTKFGFIWKYLITKLPTKFNKIVLTSFDSKFFLASGLDGLLTRLLSILLKDDRGLTPLGHKGALLQGALLWFHLADHVVVPARKSGRSGSFSRKSVAHSPTPKHFYIIFIGFLATILLDFLDLPKTRARPIFRQPGALDDVDDKLTQATGSLQRVSATKQVHWW